MRGRSLLLLPHFMTHRYCWRGKADAIAREKSGNLRSQSHHTNSKEVASIANIPLNVLGDSMKHDPERENSAVQPNASRPAHSIHIRVMFKFRHPVYNRDGLERTLLLHLWIQEYCSAWGRCLRIFGRFPQPIFKCSSMIDIDSPRAGTLLPSLPSRVTLPFRDNYG